jgi:glutamate racemase
MKIGVFDSGLGGLAISEAIMRLLPEYDYLYLGDTKRVPYGGRSQETIHEFTSQALQYLFDNDCQLIILACNTASAEALRKSQQEYLPKHFPDRRVLGVVIPTAEAVFEASETSHVGVLATRSTVESGAYVREITKQNQSARVTQQAAPLLVPLIEHGGRKYIREALTDYIMPLQEVGVQSLILGCTHYCMVKQIAREVSGVAVISQDEVVPAKLAVYLRRHPEIETVLGRSSMRQYHVTDVTPGYLDFACEISGKSLNFEKVAID